MPDELEWLPRASPTSRDGRQWPFVTPLDLLRFKPLPPLSRVRMGAAVLGDPARPRQPGAVRERHRARLDRALHGPPAWREAVGAAAAREVRRARRRHRDGLAAEQVHAAPRRRRRRGEARLPEALVGAAVRRAARPDRGRGRPRADRPPRGAGSAPASSSPRARPARSGAATTRATSRRSSPSATTPCWPRCRATLRAAARARRAARGLPGQLRSIEYFTALCLLLELDRRFAPYYWTNIADAALPFVGLIEHTNFISPERYGGRRFLYVANYLPRGHELLSLDAEAARPLHAGPAGGEPGFDRSWIKQLWLHREPAAQPIVTVGYREKIPALKTPARGLVLANTTQVFPEDRGTNYAVRVGDDAARAMLDWLPK